MDRSRIYFTNSLVTTENYDISLCFFVGTVRLYDYVDKTTLCSAKYSRGATSLLWLPKNVSERKIHEASTRYFIVGMSGEFNIRNVFSVIASVIGPSYVRR